MIKDHSYLVTLTWSGVRHGTTSSYTAYSREYTISCNGKPDLTGSADPMFRGDTKLYNPEDLFISTIASCHLLWYLHLCAEKGIHILSYIDTPKGNLQINNNGSGQFTEVTLQPTVIIENQKDVTLAKQLHELAHQKCFIANSVNFPIRCIPDIASKV